MFVPTEMGDRPNTVGMEEVRLMRAHILGGHSLTTHALRQTGVRLVQGRPGGESGPSRPSGVQRLSSLLIRLPGSPVSSFLQGPGLSVSPQIETGKGKR